MITYPTLADAALGRLAESMDAAGRGFDGSPTAPVRIQLASQEANAAALLGDFPRAHAALARSDRQAAALSPDRGTSVWSFSEGRQAIFALSVATQIRDPDRALQAAAMAESAWAAGAPKVLANWVQIRLGAGIAYLMKGVPDQAAAHVRPVFALAPSMRMAAVTAHSRNLEARLSSSQFRGHRVVSMLAQDLRGFHEGVSLDQDPGGALG